MCHVAVRLLEDGPYGKRNRTANIPHYEYDPKKHELFGLSVEVVFAGCKEDCLKKHEGKTVSAIDPGHTTPVVFLDEVEQWLEKSFISQLSPQ